MAPLRRPPVNRPPVQDEEAHRLLAQSADGDTGLLLEVYDLLVKLVGAQDADTKSGSSSEFERLSSALVVLGRRMDTRFTELEQRVSELPAPTAPIASAPPSAVAQLEVARSIEALRGEMAEMRAAIERISQVLHG